MKVVKTSRMRGWRWGEEPAGIHPQSQMGFKGVVGDTLNGQCGQLMPDWRAKTPLQLTGKTGGERFMKFQLFILKELIKPGGGGGGELLAINSRPWKTCPFSGS